ncbi:hypothetical protein ACWDOR_28625 [Streptosporangium canum]|uniref:hypothetical protein n=1 Tax=Streptosporangium canum TaxID=324952 RepID=UPI00368E6FFD
MGVEPDDVQAVAVPAQRGRDRFEFDTAVPADRDDEAVLRERSPDPGGGLGKGVAGVHPDMPGLGHHGGQPGGAFD